MNSVLILKTLHTWISGTEVRQGRHHNANRRRSGTGEEEMVFNIAPTQNNAGNFATKTKERKVGRG
jgi:hypothetical protein